MKDYLLSEVVKMCKDCKDCDKCELLDHCNHSWSVSPDQWEVDQVDNDSKFVKAATKLVDDYLKKDKAYY
jgi:hypothetical protein